MDHEDVLKRAFRLARSQPLLWVPALLTGESGGGSAALPRGGGIGITRPRAGVAGALVGQLADLLAWLAGNWPALVAGVLVLLVLGLVLSSLSAGFLFTGQVELDGGRGFVFADGLRAAAGSFRRVLALRLLVTLLVGTPLVALTLLTLWMVAAGGTNGLLGALFIDGSFLVVLAIVLFAAWPVVAIAVRLCVLRRLGAVAALRESTRLIGSRFGSVAVVAGIALGLGIVIGIATGLVQSVAALPFQAGVDRAIELLDLVALGWALLPLLAVGVPLGLATAALTGAFYSAYWTLAVVELAGDGAAASPVGRKSLG